QGIASLRITQQPTTEYKYGETLDLSNLEVTVTYSEGGGSAYVRYGDDGWNTLGLKIDEASLDHGDPLKIAHTGKKIKVTTSDGSKYAETEGLTVNPRTLYIKATSDPVTKTYDGTTAVDQTITLAIADEDSYDGTYYDGLLSADRAYTLSNATPSYTYNDKNVGTGIALTRGENVTLVGTNAGEYELTFQSLTGAITAKDVTLTPNVGETIYADKFATAGYDVASTHASNSVTTSGFVTGEDAKYDLSYTLKLTADELKSAGTVSVPVQISGADNASYVKSVTAKDATNYPLTNYNFQWQDASVAITANAMTGIAVKTDPTDLANDKVYGDGIALDNMVVTATYTDGSKHDFTYSATTGSEWANEGFTVAIEGGGDLTKLVTDNSGKHIVVSKTGVGAASTNGTLTVNQKPLTLTATATKENLTREYNSLTSADETKITLGVDGSTPLVTGDSIDYGTFTADYYSGDNKDKNVADNKTVKVSNITPTIKNSDNVDVTNQYDITQPSTLTGEIKAKEIKVTGTGVPNILTGASELTKNVTTSYTNGAIYAGDDVTVPITATYPDSLQDGTNRRTEKTVTFSIGTITGADKDNYSFTLDPSTGKGWVVDNLIDKITVTPPNDTEYEHGDKLDLTGMVIAVEYQNAIDNNTYTYVSGDNWTDKSGTTVTTTDLPVSFVLVKDGAETAVASATKQLRRDDNGPTSKLVIKGDDITNEDNGGSPINITVGTKEITTVTPGYTPPTTAAPSKTYDGTTKVPDNSFVYYSDDILDDDKDEVQSLLGATAEYAQKDASYEADGITLKDIPINFSTPTLSTNDNYTLANNATIDTSGNLKGTISKATLTITISSVPSITVGQNAEVTLTKDTHYTQSGEVTVNGVKETVDVAVKGTYTDNNTPANGTAAVTYTTDPTTLTNYNIILSGTDTTGTVSKKAVTGITVTPPSDTSYEHGDDLALDGMTITVKYAEDDSDNRTYEFTNGKWHETTGGTDTELTGIPEDVTIKWNGTATAVADGAKLRLDDTDKGYTVDVNNKKAAISVAPSA
ncbi:MAG: YDG domain-containing protein, partial [Clostridia bacterium]|nr:YDG domain-containing protein [Clostridia bacterium]